MLGERLPFDYRKRRHYEPVAPVSLPSSAFGGCELRRDPSEVDQETLHVATDLSQRLTQSDLTPRPTTNGRYCTQPPRSSAPLATRSIRRARSCTYPRLHRNPATGRTKHRRITDSPFGAYAGYVWLGRVSSVQGSWTVPRIVDPSRSGLATTWIGAQTPGTRGAFIQIGDGGAPRSTALEAYGSEFGQWTNKTPYATIVSASARLIDWLRLEIRGLTDARFAESGEQSRPIADRQAERHDRTSSSSRGHVAYCVHHLEIILDPQL